MKYVSLFLILIALSPSLRAGGFFMDQAAVDGVSVYLNQQKIRVIDGALVEITPVKAFYESRNFLTIWVDQNDRPNQLAITFKEILNQSKFSGLNPADYWFTEMDKRWKPLNRTQAIELEMLLTQSFLRFATDLANGRVEPSGLDGEIDFKRRSLKGDPRILEMLVSSEKLKQGLSDLEPKHSSYLRLKELLAQYLAIQARGGWSTLTSQTKLQQGMSHADVIRLRERLITSGDLPESEAQNKSPLFDEALKAGVLHFQVEHSLTADGIAGPQLIGVLNVSVDRRIQQLIATIEKWRWLPTDLGERYIFVNLARQELEVIENKESVLKMKAAVGQVLRRTPSLSDRVVDVALNPYWNVPQNLVQKDVLRGIQTDPNYLTSMAMKIFTPNGAQEIDPATVDWAGLTPTTVNFRFRQQPGLHNSLGLVKFNLTNTRAIYMHDTPHKENFAESTRFFSSGCVRLEKPVELAAYLLRDKGQWDMDAIKKFTRTSKAADYRIPLTNPMPVFLVFLSVSYTAEGEIRFNSDNYGQDERLLQALQPTELLRSGIQPTELLR